MTDRLRKLDALFAERVLGCKVHYGPDKCPACRGLKIQRTKETYFWRVPIDGPAPGHRTVEAGEPCGQCGGKGEVNWHGDGPVCRCCEYTHSDDRGDLKPYTRSLDAALNATSDSRERAIRFCCRDIRCDYDYIYKAEVAFDNEGHCTFNGCSCDHPAEALVLACLRAVGCTEEESK